MFDLDRSGNINVHEFSSLFKYINDWKGLFERIDADRSGFIEEREFAQGTNNQPATPHYITSLTEVQSTFHLVLSKGRFTYKGSTLINVLPKFLISEHSSSNDMTIAQDEFFGVVPKYDKDVASLKYNSMNPAMLVMSVRLVWVVTMLY